MARRKKNSLVIAAAQKRAAALQSIDPALDLGGGLTLAAYQQAIQTAQQTLDNYNALLSQVDEALNTFQRVERELANWSERMLAGVAARFGRDSSEYEKAGGKRKSEIKRRPRTKKTAA